MKRKEIKFRFCSEVEKENEQLEIQVWDWNLLGSPDEMGAVHIPIKNLTSGITHEDWYKLSPMKKEHVSGDIRVMLQYTSAKVSILLLHCNLFKIALIASCKKLPNCCSTL